MMENFRKRQTDLLKRFDLDAFLVIHVDRLLATGVDRVNLRYLSGFSGSGALIASRECAVLLTDPRYEERAEREAPGVEIRTKALAIDYLDAILNLVRELAPRSIGFSAQKTSFHVGQALATSLPGITAIPLSEPVESIRAIKDEAEVSRIRAAIEITQDALTEIFGEIRPGVTEHDLAIRLRQGYLSQGADEAFDQIIASGANSAIAHHATSDRRIREGELLLFDIGARVDGYVSDISRTLHVGKASAQVEDMYQTVLAAQQAGIAAVGPGVSILDVRERMESVLRKSPFASAGRVSGHGIGLEVHEPPYLRSEGILQAGAVLTIEPGIYVSGLGGIRIEDDILVTPSGRLSLTTLQKERLISIG